MSLKLILDLLGPPRLMGARTRRELISGSLTVGRSPEADWVIPDVDRLISRLHLRIDAGAEVFILTDTSANGVFLNGSEAPVGHGASAKLGHGDRLRIGDATIAVAFADQAESATSGRIIGTFDAPTEDASRETRRFARDAADGPFGVPAQSAPVSLYGAADVRLQEAASRQAVAADWMITPGNAATNSQVLSEANKRDVPAITSGTTRDEASARPSVLPSLLHLVELKPDLSARRLAEAIDAAGRSVDFKVWQAFCDRVDRLVRAEQERPVDRALLNGRVVG